MSQNWCTVLETTPYIYEYEVYMYDYTYRDKISGHKHCVEVSYTSVMFVATLVIVNDDPR